MAEYTGTTPLPVGFTDADVYEQRVEAMRRSLDRCADWAAGWNAAIDEVLALCPREKPEMLTAADVLFPGLADG